MINKNIIISDKISLIDSLSIMDDTNRKLLIVCEGKKFLGVISIGDIQRAILNKQNLSQSVSSVARQKVTYALESDDIEKVKAKMRKEKIEAMPVINEKGELCDVIEWNQLFSSEKIQFTNEINFPVVIMAGGKGTRLRPLTHVIPKPLIPISDKTIMEEIMIRFKEAGCKKYYISVNYMMETIKEYFRNKSEWDICYLQERKPLGTGGSLYLLKDTIDNTFFVTNCDTLVDIDLFDLVDYHKRNNNFITVVSAVKKIHIPYGTIETETDGVIRTMREKPDLVYQLNSGFYVMEPEVLNYVEDEQFLNIPDLIKLIIDDGNKVGAFPVSDGSWIDMGNWDEYLRLIGRYYIKE